jgi:hypothetical protein
MNAETIKTCIDCGRRYYADAPWKIRCISCWKSSKQNGQPDVQVHWLRGRLDQAEARARFLQAENERLCRELARARPGRTTGLAGLDVRKWRWLAQTTHPDHHGGSPMATEIMQWLNAIRPR